VIRQRKCRHEVVQQWFRWFGKWLDHRPRLCGWERVGCDAETCIDCGAWLSLGPSTDTPATTLELKLAAHIADICQLWEPEDQDELIERYVDGFSSQPITHLEGE
jgi:hypothetical protein